jgi:hypothetical protein
MRCETGLRATVVRYASVCCWLEAVRRTDGYGRQGWERYTDRSRSGIPTVLDPALAPRADAFVRYYRNPVSKAFSCAAGKSAVRD